MATINYAYREIVCKVVYYGPGVGGKTTNLQVVHSQVAEQSRGDLVSLSTQTDRTLYFDFLPLDLGEIKGFKVRFQLYTVPGQVQYNATRKLVLQGVDGLVFVADSQENRMKENLESLQNLRDNLAEYNLKLEELPYLLQLNKRDLPDISSVEEMSQKLSIGQCPVVEAVAIESTGVKETLKKISVLVLKRLSEQSVGGVSNIDQTKTDESSQQQTSSTLPVSESPISNPDDVNDFMEEPPPKPETPQKTEQEPESKWQTTIPDSSIHQQCDLYWNKLKIGNGYIDISMNPEELKSSTPQLNAKLKTNILGLFKAEKTIDFFAMAANQLTFEEREFFLLLGKDQLGIMGNFRNLPNWRIYLQKGDMSFIFAIKKAPGGKILLVPEGKRDVSPE